MSNHWVLCDICGFRYKRNQMKKNSYGLLVCPTDFEGAYDLVNHPQNYPFYEFDDPKPLEDVRTDVSLAVASVEVSAILSIYFP